MRSFCTLNGLVIVLEEKHPQVHLGPNVGTEEVVSEMQSVRLTTSSCG